MTTPLADSYLDLTTFIRKTLSRVADATADTDSTADSTAAAQVLTSDTGVAEPHGVDIYVPQKQVAVDINAVSVSTESSGRDKWYHYRKYELCRQQGVRLFTVWGDDYARSPDLVKSMIAQHLGTVRQEAIYPRNTFFTRVPGEETRGFLSSFHIRGAEATDDRYGIRAHFGLRERRTERIAAVMGVKYHRERRELEITRFATRRRMPNGFSKLLKNVVDEAMRAGIRANSIPERIVAHSHNDYSQGEPYATHGFTPTALLDPECFYAVDHLSERFRSSDTDIFGDDFIQHIPAERNRLDRIWDCGSIRWEKPLF